MFAGIFFLRFKDGREFGQNKTRANIKEFIVYITMAYIVSMSEVYGYKS